MPLLQPARKLKVSVGHSWAICDLAQIQWLTAVSSTELSGLTGLRLRMTGLGDVPRLPGRALSRFYALKEMKLMGSCMCHGHANRCLPEVYDNAPNSVKVCRWLMISKRNLKYSKQKVITAQDQDFLIWFIKSFILSRSFLIYIMLLLMNWAGAGKMCWIKI